MRSTHVSCKFVKKKFVFKFSSMKNGFFYCAVPRPAQGPNVALDLVRDCTCLNAFALVYTSQTYFIQFLTFFLIFDFCEKRKKSFSILANSNTKIFFYKLKAESSLHMCVIFFQSRV